MATARSSHPSLDALIERNEDSERNLVSCPGQHIHSSAITSRTWDVDTRALYHFQRVFVRILTGQDSSGASREASTRALMAGVLTGRFACKLVGERCTEIDLLPLDSGIGLLLDIEHGLGAAIRHVPVWTEDAQLVLQRRHVQRFIAGIVVRWHHSSDLIRSMRVDPLQGLDIGIHQLLDGIFMTVDVVVFHKDADEGVRPAESRLGRLRCAQVDQDFADATR